MKYRYDISQIPRDMLETYARQQLGMFDGGGDGPIHANSQLGKEIVKLAEVKLRTRAEVDKDILEAIRSYHEQWPGSKNFGGCFEFRNLPSVTLAEVLNALLDEETSD
jgi:hypothetical protein